MRQLRLRDLGGIIVIDFIDMKQERHKRELENEVREESRKDRSQMVLLPLSQFCLLEIARQKTRPSLQVVSSDPCPACGGTGYRGRIALFEVLTFTEELRELIAVGASTVELQRAAVASGMRTLFDDGVRLCLEGVTTVAEVRRVVGDPR